MRYIVFILVLFMCFPAYARKAFYDPTTNKTIIDISGKKSKAQVMKEFNLTDCQELTFDEKREAVRIDNGQLITYDYVIEEEQRKQDKKQKKDAAKQELKDLGFSNQTIKEILGD